MRLIGPTATFALAIALATQAHALDAFWHGARSTYWNDGIDPQTNKSNWYAQAPPNGNPQDVPDVTAFFPAGALNTLVKVYDDSSVTTIATMRFPATSPAYRFLV